MTTVTLCDFKDCGERATYRATLEPLGIPRLNVVGSRNGDDWTVDVCDLHLTNVSFDSEKIDDSLWGKASGVAPGPWEFCTVCGGGYLRTYKEHEGEQKHRVAVAVGRGTS